MKPVMLQINKEVDHDAVIDLVDQLISPGVDDLHLIAEIHIDLLRELAIKPDKPSVLVESCFRSDNALIAHEPIQVEENFIERHERPVWKLRQWNIHA